MAPTLGVYKHYLSPGKDTETSKKPPTLVPMACRFVPVSCGQDERPQETGSALLKRDATPRAESVTPVTWR